LENFDTKPKKEAHHMHEARVAILTLQY